MGKIRDFDLDLNLDQEKKLSDLLGDLTGHEFFKSGFARVQEVFLKHFKQADFPFVITVVGTNGKGGTSHCLAQLCESQNISYALWTSPHWVSVRERFCFSGELVSYATLTEVVHEVHAWQEELSYYELLFFSFLTLAKRQKEKLILLEAGLGGRLDAVNLLQAKGVILTSLSRDHQEILGPRLEDILREKLGVLRRGTVLVYPKMGDYLESLAESFAEQSGAQAYPLSQRPQSYQAQNAQLAQLLFHKLIGPATPVSFLERRGLGPEMTLNSLKFIFRGAHNVEGFRQLQQEKIDCQEVWLSFSQRDEKDLETMMKLTCSLGQVVLFWFDGHKALSLNRLKDLGRKFSVQVERDWKSYFENRLKHKKILVSGSLYFVGLVQTELFRRS